MSLFTKSRLLLFTFCLAAFPSQALVKFDEGQRMIRGVQLLQDFSDPNAYYYVPQYPRLATREDGTLELLCLKYVGANGTANGGLFHALVEFTLPPDDLEELEKELKKEVPGGRIVGPVPLLPAADNGAEGMGSFQIVSAILNDKEKGGFSGSVITSGKAPVLPGSKAAVAAILNQQGATLLWDSFTGAASDVSVAIHASYEAATKGYNAKVTAEVETVYEHFSRISNVQKDYTKRQLRNVIDELRRNGTLKVEVLDRSAGLGINVKDMEAVLQVVTDKLTELMFDHKTGWAKDPEREAAVEANQIKGRQERGWFASVFGGADDTKYFTDDQFVLKNRRDVRKNSFSLVLAKSSTIRLPVDTAGNLRGLFAALGRDTRYFRVVNLDDPVFEKRTVHFQVDGAYLDSFQDTINFVAVNFRKVYGGAQPDLTRSLHFTYEDFKAGKPSLLAVEFPRLGLATAGWTEYEYQVRWSLRDGPTVSVPAGADQWVRSKDPVVALVPPFRKRVVEIETDRQLFTERGLATAVIDFATYLSGQPRLQRKATLRSTNSDPITRVSVYSDLNRERDVAFRAAWYSSKGSVKGKFQSLDSDYLYLVPPTVEELSAQSNGGGQ